MPTVEENLRHWSGYDWSKGGDEWSETWGSSARLWWGTLYSRLMDLLPASSVLEIAPGFGRITQYLQQYAGRLTLVDLTRECIEACQKRFGEFDHIEYHVNDGRSLDMIPDRSIDLAFSFDSLVHVESESVLGYVRQLAKKLTDEGVIFFHHSNLGAFVDEQTGELTIENRHWRAPSVSAALVSECCDKEGLVCIRQELINWGGDQLHDCFSIICRKGSARERVPVIVENPHFMGEAVALGKIYRHYSI